MELIVCLGLAISGFVLLIGFFIGLFSAPTPILVVILITGILITEKSINNQFQTPEINLEEREKNRVESLEVAVSVDTKIDEISTEVQQAQPKKDKSLMSMSYRGFNYMRSPQLDKVTSKAKKNKSELQYRGRKTKNSANTEMS